MDLDPKPFFALLHKYLQDEISGPKQCNQLFINLNDTLTRQQVNLSDLDGFLHSFFHRTNGITEIVTKIANKKQFKSSVINIFEIIYTLINNFSKRLGKYINAVYDVCFKIIKSGAVTSDEKVRALDVVTLSFEKINKSLENPECYKEVYSDLQKLINIKKCSSVEDKIYKALGSFAKHFPYLVTNAESLKHLFLSVLDKEMVKKEYSGKTVSGVFSGLDAYCESFPFNPESSDDLAIINQLLKHIQRLVTPVTTIKVANRAALTFFAHNISLFVPLLIDKIQFWHEVLLKWLSFGPEDQKVGFYVIKTLYWALGNFLINDIQQHKRHTLYLLECFKNTLNNAKASIRERHLCLHGLLSFSGVYLAQLSENETRDIVIQIIQNFERNFIVQTEVTTEYLEDLPSYLQTIAKFVHFRKITNCELFYLQKGTIMLIKEYPKLPYSSHEAAIEAIVATFYYLLVNNEKSFDFVVENVIYEGVVWTCSHHHVSESELVETDEKLITVRSYSKLWKSLLTILPLRKFDKYHIFLNERKHILMKVIDRLMKTLLVLINKLNVSIVLNNSEPVTDINNAYKVAEVNDFAIFLNVVDFYEDVFEQIDPTVLKKCVCKLIRHLVSKCDKFPLISGFYKLLSFSLKTCNKMDYFNEANTELAQDVKLCNLTLTKFSESILNRSKQFKGDLLIACLQVLLQYPVDIIRQVLPSCVSCFQTIFYIGRSYIKLPHMALDTLEYWQKNISSEEIESFLVEIVPLFDFYLQSKSLGNVSESNFENRRKTAKALKKRSIVISIEPELIRLQFRIIQFIGEQGHALCRALAFRENDNNLTVWSSQQHLRIILPYKDYKLEFYLDKLIPRVTYIALNCTDRKTKIMACELLQAIVMIFLGTTKQMPHSALSDLNELLRFLSVPLLQLGCDPDQVVEQLFGPLCFQLIHWYTHASQSCSEHSAIFMEAVLESITHPTDTALRDFSGKCINEYAKWTIKQTTERNLINDPINIKMLLKKMRFYSMHPDPFKRLGAALVFNNIYRVLREETPLFSMFWLEFLHIFIKSLTCFEFEIGDDSSVTQINNALTHLERGFVEKKQLFNEKDANRRVPHDMETGVLTDAAKWLFEQSGSLSFYARTKSLELFCNIVPHTKGYVNLETFFATHYKNVNWIQMTFEKYLDDYQTPEKLAGCESMELNKWLQGFLCALDGYIFATSHKLLPNQKLSKNLKTAIMFFISKMSSLNYENCLNLVQAKEWLYTIREKHIFNRQKSQAAVKIFQLLSDCKPDLYNSDLWNLLVNVIFNPESIGFEDFYSEKNNKTVNILKTFLSSLLNKSASDVKNFVEKYLGENLKTTINLKHNVSLKQRNLFKGLNLLKSFALNNFDFLKFANGHIENLFNNFVEEAEDDVIYLDNLQDTTVNYCLLMLDFVLSNDHEFKSFVDFLYKPYQVQTTSSNQSILFGTFILTVFEDSVVEEIVKNFELFLSLSLEKYTMVNQTIEIIKFILSRIVRHRGLKYINESIVRNVQSRWNRFEDYFMQKGNLELGVNFVKCLIPILKNCKLEFENVRNWLTAQLLYKDNDWKFELDLKVDIFQTLVLITNDEDETFKQNLNVLKERILSIEAPIEAKQIFFEKLLTVNKITPKVATFLLALFVKLKSETDMKTFLANHIISQNQQNLLLIKTYNLCKDDNFTDDEKYKLVISIIPIFQYCGFSIFEDFFVDKMCEIVATLKQETTTKNLLNKIFCFILLEVLFLRCPIESSVSETSKVAKTLSDNMDNKKCLLTVLKLTLDAIKDNLNDSNDFFRIYKCHSYNAMVSIVTNSMKGSNFYTKLFIRQEDNTEILWKSLIDTNKVYVFQNEFDTIPQKRKFLVNIRDEIRAQKRAKNINYQSAKYMETLRVFNSSLSEDLTKFDFTNSVIRSQSENEESIEQIHAHTELELDCTDVNNHECMANVCGLIEHMINSGITDLPDEEQSDYELPGWLNAIRSILLNCETHDNVKIFWVKVIDNTSHIFKHFAKWFIEPLLKFIVDKSAGSSINYFISDVVAILASWSVDVQPTTQSEIDLTSKLLIFLINNLSNERQDIFKYHLELIRLIIESWKSSISVSYETLWQHLNVDPTSKKVEVGIHLFSVFLANKIFPWTDKIIDTCKTLFSIIMKNTHKSAYKPCSETVGLLLSIVNDPKIFRNVHVLLSKISEPEKYANVLESMCLRYPEIVDDYHLNKLLGQIHGVPKEMKVIYLKVLLSRHRTLGTLSDFKAERWDSYIENDNLEVQLVAMELVHKCLPALEDSLFFTKLVQSLCAHVTSPNVLCRTKMYDILITLNDSSNDYFSLCNPVLVQGLTDSDKEIREKVFEFWRNNQEMPDQISLRFPYILSKLYEVNTESDFLGCGSFLLLDIIKKTEEYSKMLFEHPLEDCDFENYHLQANWRARNLSVVPLFAETLSSLSMDLETADFNQLRQTQTVKEFAPTQTQTGRAREFSQYTMGESSLFVKSQDDSGFVNPNLINLSEKYKIPKRRFLRDRAKIQKSFAQWEMKKNVKTVEQRRDKAKERENKVTIYRSYRKGDLPDVQITLEAVLEPLQVLTLYDGEVAKILYSEIFDTVLTKLRNDVEFTEEVASGIKFIFSNSVQFNRSLFRTLFDALMRCKDSVRFSVDLIVSVCQQSGLRALGVLLLEEYLTNFDSTVSESKKMRGPETCTEKKVWIKLAELYKDLEEWDIVKSIFLEKTDSSELVKNALLAESHKEWKNAQDIYKNLIQTDESLERKDFYYESYFKCFAHLGEWSQLITSLDSIVEHSGNNCWDELWDKGFNQQKLMPWYISGQLKNTLFSEKSNDFLQNLNYTLNSNRSDYLENNFSEEIAMFWIFKEETDESERYLTLYMNTFLGYWQQLDLFYSNIRYSKLLKLRNIVDIKKFLNVFTELNIESKSAILDLIKHWQRTSHEPLPSILYNEEKVLYRRPFIKLLLNKINLQDEDETADVIAKLKEVKCRLDEGLMDIALNENNFYMTKKYLNTYGNQNVFKLKIFVSKIAVLKSLMLNDAAKKLEVLLKGCISPEQIFSQRSEAHLKIEAYMQLFKTLDTIANLLCEREELLQNNEAKLKSLLRINDVTSENIALFGANKLRFFLEEYENDLRNEMETELKGLQNDKVLADAYVQLAMFTMKRGKELFTDFILYVLRSIKYGSSEGRQLFPCVIMEQELRNDQIELFIKEVDAIPTWMFLGWIPQILVNVSDPCKVAAVAPLLLKIAKSYPQAIMYSYRLSKEAYKSLSEDSNKLIQKLDALLLSDSRVDTFLKGLSFVGIPVNILFYYLKKLGRFCVNNNAMDAQSLLEFIDNEIFNCKPDSRDVGSMQGNMFKQISKFEKDFKNIQKILSKSLNADLVKHLKKINDDLTKISRDRSESKKESRLLKDYCPWLANFSGKRMGVDLEIPGQYDGNKMPLKQHHIRISGFCPNVLVMSSLRKPIKITILGNDTKEYSFLIKFGEDVRQDQRVQQLFSLMNNVFYNDKILRGRNFAILTYEVIPLTSSLGIIQWIDKTRSLQEFVKDGLGSPKSLKSYDQLFDSYNKWIQKSANQQPVDAYGQAAIKYGRDKVIPKYRSMVSSLEWDILRTQFLKLSLNKESFFVLRDNFIKSYAVMCAAHWLLGVGDRHLSNSLICLQNGKVLGIDFGHAFGTATQILPIPELVPFRLTPHIVNLMEPLGEKGLFKEILIHCLRTLRSNSGSLLATMKVFICEPSLDWLEHALRLTDGSNSGDHMWYPNQKIDQAERKLRGVNPVTILVEDLKAGHQKNPNYLKAYVLLVEGSSEFDVRARKSGNELSVEDQVDCLIDHATDYNLLGRMYGGWAPWV